MTTEVTYHQHLPEETLKAVRAAAEAVSASDGVDPLSEAFLLDLPRSGEHLVVTDENGLAGYAQVAEDGSVEAFVISSARGEGVGRRLLEEVLRRHPRARVWAHGDLPAARSLMRTLGLEVVRKLLVLSRPVSPGDEVDPALPEGVRHRTFEPGRDEEALLATNAAAFADHPEQGSLDADGLADRMAQPWFDPEGLILLEGSDPDHLAGFHWTKIDPPGGEIGEVYVVAVHPDLHGGGLGGPLTRLGLAHLARRGVQTVELYVEGDNHPALATYRRAGFTRAAAHVMYSRVVHDPVEG